ncbi:HD domain-containing protein [Priestia megaterium]|uniref:HD domain-containing protein n=1 Tax=Priestia megaterium TaxID=1404 RepID=UPI0025A48E49|nr:ATP-binding protein [Priestia megaterium]MDM8151312.1 ATP-binding protein [Priestia megaterium]
MYSNQIKDRDIDIENKNFINKPLAFEKQTGFPYYDLYPRDFERLVYCLYKDNAGEMYKDINYDEIQLMQGVGERGRDCVLLNRGTSVGIIQCKRYKNNIDVSEVGKEIVKFILHYTQDTSLIPNLNNFTYVIAVSYGFSEKSMELINSLISNNYNKVDIEVWAETIIKNTARLKSISFDDVKETVYDCINKMNFQKIIPDNLNLIIEKYPRIKSMFFDLKSVIDIKSFETLLVDREKNRIELLYKSSNLERALESKNVYLYNKLKETKEVVGKLINDFSANFIIYTDHIKQHTENITKILGDKLLDEDDLANLNETELYILSTASYLHDIGVCISNEEIEERYINYSKNINGYSFLELDEYIREQHSYLTYDFILNNWETLGLEKDWKEAIALVAGKSKQIDVFDYKYFEYAPDGRRAKVCLPYLNALIQIADMIDIENYNANFLLRNYKDMDEYKLSKKIWEEAEHVIKSIATPDNRLIFEGECKDQLIYISVNQCIQELKHKLEQLNSKIRKYNYKYKFSLNFIEEKLDSSFKKKLGFSIDYNGITDTLIGRNIYENEYDALREVLQNSIDSCSLRKIKDNNYTPSIEIELTDTAIIIRDNGMGMDEYIIRNYFANLCKSYYKDFSIDAIGQFGIGVFSYFMLCDSFTVETKIKDKPGLKFKAYKNLHSYFYFYEEESTEINNGTKITLHLKEKVLNSLSFKDLIAKIRSYFKFIDIPLKVINNNLYEIITKEKFHLNLEEELNNKIDYTKIDIIERLKILESYIENEMFEGIVGLIFENDNIFPYNPISLNFITDDFSYRGNMLICQKGVNVLDGSLRGMLHNSFFKVLLGKINIKKKLNLNLSRSHFNDEYLKKVMSDFEKDLLSKFFSNIHNLKPREAYQINSLFVRYNIKEYSFPYNELEIFILDNFYVQVYTQAGIEYMTLSAFLRHTKEFIFIGGSFGIQGEEKRKETINRIKRKSHLPLIYIEDDNYCHFYMEFFKKMDRSFILHNELEDSLVINVANTQIKEEILKDLAVPFENDLLFDKVETLYYGLTLYNTNHSLIQLYLLNLEQIKANKALENKFHQLFKLIEKTYKITPTQISLTQTNKLLNEITIILNSDITITVDDFPKKFRKHILN